MRLSRLIILVPITMAFLAGYGCSSQSGDPNDFNSQLETDTGVAWTSHANEDSKEVRFLVPEKPVRLGEGTPEQQARSFFNRYQDHLHGRGEDLRALETEVNADGTSHVRFEHYVPGTDIPILNTASTAHFTKNGEAYYLQPGFRAGIESLPKTASISEADAIKSARGRAIAECGVADEDITTVGAELAVRNDENLPALLVWRVPMRIKGKGCIAPQAIVDATTGEVARLTETAQGVWDLNAKGFHFYRGEAKDVKGIDVTPDGNQWVLKSTLFSKVITKNYNLDSRNKLEPTDIKTSALGQWSSSTTVQGTEVDAHYHATHALEFWRSKPFERKGLDGNHGDIILVIHDGSDPDNASHVGSDGKFFKDDYLHFGDGDFQKSPPGDDLPFATAYDVVVHETAHAVTAHTSKLFYQFQSGALNESFSDVMGACAERRLEGKNDAKNFRIGERMSRSGQGLRNMADPPSTGGGIDHLSNLPACSVPNGANDSCGVHTNSGIPNRAFSLMTAGGKHKSSKVGVADPIGWEKAEKLWYKTLTSLTPQATFRDAALAQVVEAYTNKEYTSEDHRSVACAWHAVGVIGKLDGTFHHSLRDLRCVPPQTSCKGVPDGTYVCNSQDIWAANRCEKGEAQNAVWCPDMDSEVCKHGPDDMIAKFNNGKLECQPK